MEKVSIEVRKTWQKDGLELSVVWIRDHYCGYAKFPKRPTRERGHSGILTYVPVHGGITYSEEDGDGWKYGFDCAHCDDYVDYRIPSISPLGGHKWTEEEVIAETEKMTRGIQLATKYEVRYLRNISNKGKAKVIDQYHKELGEKFDVRDNVGASLNLLCGKL